MLKAKIEPSVAVTLVLLHILPFDYFVRFKFALVHSFCRVLFATLARAKYMSWYMLYILRRIKVQTVTEI